MSLQGIDIRAMLRELSKVVARAWGGGKIQEQLKQPEPDPDPQWLLNMAVRGDRADFVRQLLAAGVDPHGKDPEGKAAWQNAVGAEVARVLLEAGVSPDGTNRAGAETWLHLAAFHQEAATVGTLLEAGADVNRRDRNNYTPLMIAARYGDPQIIDLLLEKGADPNAATPRGWCDDTALTIAAGEGKDRAVQSLIRAGADVAAQGHHALWNACGDRGKGHLQCLRYLLAAGANPNGGQYTPLMRAAGSGSAEMVRVLAAAGADVNAVTAFGTALHKAVDENRADTAAALLEVGADPHLPSPPREGDSDSGKSALELARAKRRKKLVAVLEAPVPETSAAPASEATVAQAWERIEKWLKKHAPKVHRSLGKPATPEALAQAERDLGFGLLEEFRAAYLLHDGQTKDLSLVPPAQEGDAGYSLLPVERVVREWKVWKELVDDGEFEGETSSPDPGIRDDWWNAAWIPFTTNGGGDHHCLDLAPAEGGVRGQVITMYHADTKRERVAGSVREWLLQLADDLESGTWSLDADGGLERG